MEENNEKLVLELKLQPVWGEIERAREECRTFVQKLGSNEDTTDAVCMITSEILENAIKYGDYSRGNQEITYKLESGRDGMLVQSWSPVPQGIMPENLKRLDTIIQWIRGFQSPFQAYLERLKIVAGQPLDDNESGLGLVRIAYEGEAILDFFINHDDIMYVSALLPEFNKDQEVFK